MEIKSFKSYLVEDTKDITFVFGRFKIGRASCRERV